MLGSTHGLFSCPCEPCLVLLNSTRIEDFMRIELGAKGQGMMQMASGIKTLDKDVRVALSCIATVRNRFCHQSPWFFSEREKSDFIHKVRFLNDKFQLDYWRGGAISARVAQIQRNQNAEQQRAQQQQLRQQDQEIKPLIANAYPSSSRPSEPPPRAAAAGLQQGYVRADDEKERKKIEEAKGFVASQKMAVMESQRLDEDEEDNENEEFIARSEDVWKCPYCQFDNDIENVLCVVCGEGVPEDRWKCQLCTHVNFRVESSCAVCEEPKLSSAREGDKLANKEAAASTHQTKRAKFMVLPEEIERSSGDEEQTVKLAERSPEQQRAVPIVGSNRVIATSSPFTSNPVTSSSSSVSTNQGTASSSSLSNPVLTSSSSSSLKASIGHQLVATRSIPPSRKGNSNPSDSNSLNSRPSDPSALLVDDSLPGWVLEKNDPPQRVYRHQTSGNRFTVKWPLPNGWKLAVSTSKPSERLCFVCKGRKQSVYPPEDVPEGWFLVNESSQRRTYQRIVPNSGRTEPILFETPWPLPEGWILAVSRSRPNQLCYMNIANGTKSLKFPTPSSN